jgi:hypothetical protein
MSVRLLKIVEVGVARLGPVGSGAVSTRKGNAMTKNVVPNGIVTSGIERTWENVTASFELVLSDWRHRDTD